MSRIVLSVHLPLDTDGFLRRECSNCEREFKWRPTPPGNSEEVAPVAPAECYFCPYCYESAATDTWWTKGQLEYLKQAVLSEAVAPELRRLKASFDAMNQAGGLLRIDAQIPSLTQPESLSEPDDMSRVAFPCHPEKPIKVDERWNLDVACLVCGIRYPITLVRAQAPDDGGS